MKAAAAVLIEETKPSDMVEREVRGLVRCYGAFQVLFGLMLWLPIFYEYQKRMGLSDSEIFAIQGLYQIAFCFLEIPTGFIADRFGYRLSLRLGAFTVIVANLLPIFLVDYTSFLVHFVLVAAARSFISGASSAYLYEAFYRRGQASRYKQIEGSVRAYGHVSRVVCWIGVGAMMNLHVTLPYWLSAFFSLLSFGFALFLPKLPRMHLVSSQQQTHPAFDLSSPSTTPPVTPSSLETIGDAFAALTRQPILLIVMLQGVAIFVLSRISQATLFQPILSSKTLSLETHGWVMAAMTTFEAIGAAKPTWVRALVRGKKRTSAWSFDFSAVTVLTLIITFSLAAIPWLGPWSTILALCIHSLAVGWSFPIQRQLMNDIIPDSRYRATLLSVESIIDRGVSAVVTLVLARYMAAGAMDSFLVGSGIATIVAMFVVSAAASRVLVKRSESHQYS